MAPWVRNPHGGGVKIPEAVRQRVRHRIESHAEKHYAGRYTRLDIFFRGHFCYIDAYVEPYVSPTAHKFPGGETCEEHIARLRNIPVHLCRLRYFGDENSWSFAYYTYSNEKYSPAAFRNGTFYGTPEEAFDVGASRLQALSK